MDLEALKKQAQELSKEANLEPLKPPGKQDVLERLLRHGLVRVTVDTCWDYVHLPPEQMEMPYVTLSLSYKFPNADLKVRYIGVSANLSFHGKNFECSFPLESICYIKSDVANVEIFYDENGDANDTNPAA